MHKGRKVQVDNFRELKKHFPNCLKLADGKQVWLSPYMKSMMRIVDKSTPCEVA